MNLLCFDTLKYFILVYIPPFFVWDCNFSSFVYLTTICVCLSITLMGIEPLGNHFVRIMWKLMWNYAQTHYLFSLRHF